MGPQEYPVTFPCEGELLLGILSRPGDTARERSASGDIGVVVIVGGPQYRVGAHRQFRHLAQRVSAHGYPVLRFDVRGMGDSSGDHPKFSRIGPDIKAAITALCRCEPSVRQVVLWGLCDGASAALLYCHERKDPQVIGMCLLNPWVRSDASFAKTQLKHYYTRRLRQKDFWHKLVNGKVAASAVSGLVQSLGQIFRRKPPENIDHALPFQDQMALAWRTHPAQIALLLSGNDYTAKEFLEYAATDPAWSGLIGEGKVTRRDLKDADHTFSNQRDRAQVENWTIEWIEALAGAGP
jgi:uncharacterized protein